jgi:hypothetical protein
VPPFPLLDELPEVELQAMALDGESYRLADAYLPIGIRAAPPARAAAALGDGSPRLIAGLSTAAWIWGARDRPSGRREFLVDLTARWRPPLPHDIHIVESIVREGDAVRLGRARVTTPLRTVVDLARFRREFDATDAELIRRLARIGGFDAEHAVAAMDRGRNLAGKREAARRIRLALSRS